MIKEITLCDTKVIYSLNKNKRVKGLNITLKRDMRVLVSCPVSTPQRAVEDFLVCKSSWILKNLEEFEKNKTTILPEFRGKKLNLMKEYAKIMVERYIAQINEHYRFSINKISVKNTKRQWGSCSEKGNLSFSYKIIFLPTNLAEYIIAHELCHIGEFGHGANFWNLVSETIPNYKELDKKLDSYQIT